MVVVVEGEGARREAGRESEKEGVERKKGEGEGVYFLLGGVTER